MAVKWALFLLDSKKTSNLAFSETYIINSPQREFMFVVFAKNQNFCLNIA